MFAELLLMAAQISIPLGKPPRVIEQPRAPIETSGPLWVSECAGSDDWNKPAPPVRIHANTYLVGTCGISSILIVGSDGDILIDGGTERGRRPDRRQHPLARFPGPGHQVHPAQPRASRPCRRHFQVAAAEWRNGHRVGAGPQGARKRRAGRRRPAVRHDQALPAGRSRSGDRRQGRGSPRQSDADGHDHPGPHARSTKLALGQLRWRRMPDDRLCRQPVAGQRPQYRFSDHPAYVAAYRASIAKVAASPCEILLTPHPSASHMSERLAHGKPLLDPSACRDYAADLTAKLDERLAKETATALPPSHELAGQRSVHSGAGRSGRGAARFARAWRSRASTGGRRAR